MYEENKKIERMPFFIHKMSKYFEANEIASILAKGASGSFAVMVLGTIIAFGTNIILARALGVTQYGVYIYVLTWINVFVLVCQLGMNTSFLKFIPSYNAKKEWSLFLGLIRYSMLNVLLASVFVVIAGSLIVWGLFDYIGKDQAYTFWIALLLVPIIALTGLRQAALRALKHVVKAGLPDSLFRPTVIAVLTAGAFIVSSEYLHATQVMMFNLLGALTAFIIGTAWLKKLLPEQLRLTQPLYNKSEWLKVSLPLFFMACMNMVLHQTDIIMIGALLNPEQAGIYAVTSRISSLTLFGLTAANAIVAPLISELYSTGQMVKLQKMITLSARGIFLFTLLTSVFIAVFGKQILGMFGIEFVNGFIPLLILIVGQMINALSGSVGFLMTMTGHQNQAAIILSVSAILNISLNAILIIKLGIIGAAIATATSTVVWNIAMLVYIWRKLSINPLALARI